MMMQGAHEKDPSSVTVFLFRISEIADLDDHAQAFHQEHAANDGDQPFLTDDDRQGGDDAAEGEAARIAHEDLRRIGVIPEEAQAGTDQGPDKDGQFTG